MTLDTHAKTIFGFWVYLMSDCLLFASFFATFFVLQHGPTDLLGIPLAQTLIFLVSSFVAGQLLACGDKKKTLALLGLLFVLGAIFLSMMLCSFAELVREGHSWQESGFLSAFFTLVGMHGLHVAIGLFWILVLMVQIHFRGIIASTLRRLTCLKLFWQFLNIVWIFIFSLVYLLGARHG